MIRRREKVMISYIDSYSSFENVAKFKFFGMKVIKYVMILTN
jgi:hypothetical protein